MSEPRRNTPIDSAEPPEPKQPRRQRLALIASVAATVLISAAVVAVFAFTPANSPWAVNPATPQSPAPSAPEDAPISSGEAEGAGVLSESNANSIIATVFNVSTTDAESAEALEAQLAGAVAGAYLAELESQQQELRVNGWRITGKADVLSTVVDKIFPQDDRTLAEVTSCIDTANTRVLDFDGEPLPKPDTNTRALHNFTLQQNDDGTWAVIRHTFPNDPAC